MEPFSGLNTRRLKRELREIRKNPPPLISAGIVDDNLTMWGATIHGQKDSVYENGVFELSLCFPLNYPFEPPVVTFKTRIYHCNINSHGMICLDILSKKWSPVLTVSHILVSISSLLLDCNPYDPINKQIARQYIHNRELHDKTAREWTKKYATPPE
ncbi:ubiquitin-conjugating enzyme E2-24 kDa-like [Teleopsis dalmanni]|uniref:ubiquitin-conjugating enzyme E2-24 kDa-like n=1 Tax=Teleopsis dalmanni TaxID=139649 RepID=UPI0018CF8C27|nr:ubiquitin-conjugating enzyme E2-24 kDa-like [Teleopsis dalmanni]XP_037958421.1 ubiquitin-conjugating enzyme E2-24 kDa-like [Teleopsis dalmanni]XP_037958422.1 ubiquitin-conjugating enzyme E2-24 kDa-like [Teleopsis dalmanni]XP_037958423.1 ubiquitin-conjugating enzyme E2-24 kDa-like [Teleopsis dalmanni]XP_037958424.1 ubiquitin-conjugating enzyme E2-24 kDa-like [Teleopsis dalmanni]